MTDVFSFQSGESPLLISVPHDGREIPADISARMTAVGKAIPDTDWHVAKLYDFAAELGANCIAANYSRYVIDVNRSDDDGALYPGKVATGLCPEQTFAGEAIYRSGGVDEKERLARVDNYWRPYHQKIRATLAAIRARHGYALLWDAHSIGSVVPRLFEGELPTLNLGTNDTASCDADLEKAVADVASASSYCVVVNGRFKGGYITRHYGKPEKDIHAVQLEIAQRAYMDEETALYVPGRAAQLRETLLKMLQSFATTAANASGPLYGRRAPMPVH